MNQTPAGPIIDLVDANISEPADLVGAIRKRRGGELLKLDRMLLHSPALAEGWNVYLGKIRQTPWRCLIA